MEFRSLKDLFFPSEGKKPSPIDTDYQLSRFYFQYRNSFRGGTYSYNIRKENSIYLFEYDCVDVKYGKLIMEISNEKAEEVISLLKQLKVGKWNGFNGSNPDMLDGYSFTMSADFEDGAHLYCCGENNFPDGFFELRDQLRKIFSPVIKEMLEVKKNEFIAEGVNYDIENLMCNLVKSNSGIKDVYYLRVSRGETSDYISIRLEVNSDEYIGHGEYYLDRNIDKGIISFEKLNELLKQCNVLYWNDCNGNDETSEDWYQLSFSFSDSKQISCIGSEKLENYDHFRDEIITYAISLYNQIKEQVI